LFAAFKAAQYWLARFHFRELLQMHALTPDQLMAGIRRSQREEPDSGIMQAINHGFGRQGLIPLWAGEGHLPTPDFICNAAIASLQAGETFYTWQRGLPELRQALAAYHERFWPGPFSPERFFVTGGGMQAIQTALQLLLEPGDEVIMPSPGWPNFPGPMRMMGVRPVFVPMQYQDRTWSLDLDRMADAITGKTKAICLISPSNPIGWVASQDDLIAIRDMARKAGVWIIADEVYSRFYYESGAGRAPSFMDVCDHDERVIYANTFSKNWAMTGWRIGWLQAPAALGDAIERIIQYNTSGTAAFMQRGAVAALQQGDDFLLQQQTLARDARDRAVAALGKFDNVDFEVPRGAFYLFVRIDGLSDSLNAVRRIIDEANVGLAPGGTFGPGGEGFVRLCYLRDPAGLDEALARLSRWLEAQNG
jgi:aspartate/methionine/tyrosine aminotransferase